VVVARTVLADTADGFGGCGSGGGKIEEEEEERDG